MALYIVATPLGNLRDITLRALDVLRQADVLFCEDTRHTKPLLTAYGIAHGDVRSYRDERGDAQHIVAALQQNKSVALVSDAGTPLVADPGYRAVCAVRAAGFTVVPVVGASAVIAAISAAGLPSDCFAFMGFVPSTQTARGEFLQKVMHMPHITTIFFETPHRILATLQHASTLLGERKLVIARELTKIYEEFLTGTAQELHTVLSQRSKIRGEFVLLLEPNAASSETETDDATLLQQLTVLCQSMPTRSAINAVCAQYNVPRKRVYALALTLPNMS